MPFKTLRFQLCSIAGIVGFFACSLPAAPQNVAETVFASQSQTWTAADIQRWVRQEWLPGLRWASVELERLDVPTGVVLPAGEVTLSAELPSRVDLGRPFFLNVDFQIGGRVVRRGFYRTVLAIYDTVPVSVRTLGPSDKIEAEDVRWEKRRLVSTIRKLVERVEFFEGKKPRTTIAAGQILTEDLFIKFPLIKRGDSVVMLFDGSNMRLTTKGISLAAGSKGDRIRIMNSESRREMVAEVLDEKTVRVN